MIKMWEKAYEIVKRILGCGFELLDNNYCPMAQEIKHYHDFGEDYPIEINGELVGFLSVNDREAKSESVNIRVAIEILQILFQ